jgi:hypothetical protein
MQLEPQKKSHNNAAKLVTSYNKDHMKNSGFVTWIVTAVDWTELQWNEMVNKWFCHARAHTLTEP